MDDESMKIDELAKVRRANLKRYVDGHLDGNLSELARIYRPDNPRPNFFSDLLRAKKNFGEKLAAELESCLNLKYGQLSLDNSPLELREPRKQRLAEDIQAQIADLTTDEQAEALRAIVEIKSRRKARKRA